MENIVAIRVIKTPSGEAPEEIREQWVGLILPGYFCNECGSEVEIITKQRRVPSDHYHIPIEEAITALMAGKRNEAAEWFKWYVQSPFLIFRRDEVKVLGSE